MYLLFINYCVSLQRIIKSLCLLELCKYKVLQYKDLTGVTDSQRVARFKFVTLFYFLSPLDTQWTLQVNYKSYTSHKIRLG